MFETNKVYRRSEIHDRYGGNRQSGISPSAQTPNIFIFSGKSGERYGYYDEWLNDNVFSYTGEGKVGDMRFTSGNLALKDHFNSGKRVFLFHADGDGFAKYITELELFDIDYFEGLGEDGIARQAIRFFFKKIGGIIPYANEKPDQREFNFDDVHDKPPTRTERTGLVTSRVGQGAYRKSIIHRWENKCAVTGYNHQKILIASHIVPWKDSTDSERHDVDNGILLSPTYDALFDKHLISFGDDGEILLSQQAKLTPLSRLGVTGEASISGLRDRNIKYLERHRLAAGV